MTEWGWEKLRRVGWKGADGRGCYEAIFRRGGAGIISCPGLDYRRIRFWAAHPKLAMKAIHLSGRDPAEFDGEVIN